MIDQVTFFQDGGHGWIEVPRGDLVELGIMEKISHYSYQLGDLIYLEEDCDAAIYLRAYQEHAGEMPEITEHYHGPDSPIRGYMRVGDRIQ